MMRYSSIGITLLYIGVVAARVFTNSRHNFNIYSPKNLNFVTVSLPYRISIVMAFRAPKQWKLTTEESLSSYLTWQQNVMYNLSLDKDFSPFIIPLFVWVSKDTSETEPPLTRS